MTLVDYLRQLPDDALAGLVRARPDLATPVPADIPALAGRARSRLSVARALEALDLFTLEIVDALRLAGDGPVSLDQVLRLVGGQASGKRVREAVEALRERALVYGPDDALTVAPAVADCCSPYPANLGRPAAELDAAAAQLASDPEAVRQALSAAPDGAQQVLERLAAGPPLGTVTGARGVATGNTPVRWLITRHLLVPVDDATVELPREIGVLLRQATGPLGELHPDPPATECPQHDQDKVDAAGAGQAMEAVRQVDELLTALAEEPVPVLRAGGMGVRDLRRLAKGAGIDEQLAGALLETALVAGLLDDDREAEPRWLPTNAYDSWRDSPLANRWARLVAAWRSMTRQPGLIGTRDERDRPVNALTTEVERISAPVLRQAVLDALADLPPGAAPDPDQVSARVAWRAPRRGGRNRDDTVRWTLAEAAALGLTGLGAVTTYARLVLAGDTGQATVALGDLLPEPVDHVLVQADLTVVVPGPPQPTLAAELGLIADHESAGGATVYRVTPDSVRRALDAGMPADELHALVERRSVTPVPQGLTYLINDVARRHGGLRVGHAGGYLRSDDEAGLSELLADRRLQHLGLRRLAPTVLVTPYAPGRLLAVLREHGYAPVPEDSSGTVMVTRQDVRRAPGRTRSPRPAEPIPELDDSRASAVVEAIRRGDEIARRAESSPGTARSHNGAPVSQTLSVLQEAVRSGIPVRVGYVDAHGSDASRVVRPVSIGGGYLRAEDDRSETLHTFALHRITYVVPAADWTSP